MYRFPLPTSELMSRMDERACVWSSNETGQSEMSREECERWGLSVLAQCTYYLDNSAMLCSCHVYTAIRDPRLVKSPSFGPHYLCLGTGWVIRSFRLLVQKIIRIGSKKLLCSGRKKSQRLRVGSIHRVKNQCTWASRNNVC